MMCEPDTRPAVDAYAYDPSLLSWEQCMGDACVVCHAKWPRPRRVLGHLPDGSHVFGCEECAGLVGAEPRVSADERLFAAR